MNKILLSAAVIALIGLTSCQKCTDCECVSITSFDFDPGISTEVRNSLQATIANDFKNTYPDRTDEICEKRKDFDDAVTAYEEESYTFTETSTSSGLVWAFSGTYNCTCED